MKKKPLPEYIRAAIKCGPVPLDVESWKTKPRSKLTEGERVLRFASEYLCFPEGKMVGKPLVLDPFQCAFILASFDSPVHVKKSILSMARRGGKTLVMAVILLWFVVGGGAKQSAMVRSAAMTREQAGLLFRLMALTLQLSPALEGLYRVIPSSKKIVGLRRGTEYASLSRDAKSGHGQAIYVLVVDECGQIDAANDEFLDMLFSSMGTYEDSRVFLISTQAPNDASFFSLEIDSATRSTPDNVVCHLYAAASADLMDEANWYAANPALYGGYRSKEDIRNAAGEASRIPAKEAGFLNLFMNRRVSLESLWLAPSVWKENGGAVDLEVFRTHAVHIGLDLSMRTDLTAAVLAAQDDEGVVHLLPFVFTPSQGLDDRASRDRAPYQQWVKDGKLIAIPGATVDYEAVCEHLKGELDDLGVEISGIAFDRWRVREFQAAAERTGFAPYAEWHEVGQGFKDFSPRIEKFEELLLQGKIRHGLHPLLNMAAANAIAVRDAAGNAKLDKAKSTLRIDPIVAAVMAVFAAAHTEDQVFII